jgi:hypothetical protein
MAAYNSPNTDLLTENIRGIGPEAAVVHHRPDRMQHQKALKERLLHWPWNGSLSGDNFYWLISLDNYTPKARFSLPSSTRKP